MSAPDLSSSALQTVAAFLPLMTVPGFQFTDGKPAIEQTAPHHFEMRGYTYGPQVHRLLDALYALNWVYPFDWPEWAQTPEAQSLRNDPQVLAQATPDQLARLMTVFARQERFSDGTMLDFWDSGLLLGILQRADALAYEPRKDI
jgi:hypothetical protein